MLVLPTLNFENALWKKGLNFVVGIDEVGRGSWAGPLVAAGVILSPNFKIPKGFADSKQLTPESRSKFDVFIKDVARSYTIVEISPITIDKLGINTATQQAFLTITKSITPRPNFTLVDAFPIKHLARSKQNPIKHGDQLSATIAAASIIAKVYRDNLMEKMSSFYPYYGFEKHKGYGTKFHQLAIQKHGFSKLHRTSYKLDFLFA